MGDEGWDHTGPNVVIEVLPLPLKARAPMFRDGAEVITTTMRRTAPSMLSPRAKTHNYLNMIMAEKPVKALNPNAWAILLDEHGNLAEGLGSNIFIVREGELFTPSERYVLPGVSRQMTIDMAKGLGIKCTAGDIDLFDAANAEEMFLTSTSLCILPVKSFNGGPVADGKTPGPITKKLIDAYSKDVGCDFVGQYLKFLNWPPSSPDSGVDTPGELREAACLATEQREALDCAACPLSRDDGVEALLPPPIGVDSAAWRIAALGGRRLGLMSVPTGRHTWAATFQHRKETTMAVQHHVRNPMEWGWDRLKETGQAIGSAASTMDGAWEAREMAPPVVRKIGLDDLRQALREGARDFGACRTDVVFLCMIYPIAGLIISRFAFDYGMLPLIFPLVSGFALIAPLFGVGLYEMSRRRELGTATGWADAFAVVALARDRLGHGAGPRPDRPVRAVACRRLFHLHGDARSRSAGLGHCLRARRA